MKYKLSKPVVALATLAMVGAGFGAAALANADTTTTSAATGTQTGKENHRAPGVHGTVSGITGNVLSVTTTDPKTSTSVIYTVDATNAKIQKFSAPVAPTAGTTATKPQAPTTITVSGIAVGDTVSVQGTISGTNVTATSVMDGVMKFGGMGMGQHGESGTITAVNGSSVAITGKDGTTYTINAANSKLEKISTISVSDLAIGDTINASGTVSGTTVTADNIMDGALPMQQGGHGPMGQASASSTTAPAAN